jgi:hypothetical protein
VVGVCFTVSEAFWFVDWGSKLHCATGCGHGVTEFA